MGRTITEQVRYVLGARSWVSIIFLLIALICLIPADITIYPSDPWLEFSRFIAGLFSPEIENFGNINIVRLLINTIAFALLGVALGSVCGFILTLCFHQRFIRMGCAFVRAIHELFWALILMQVFGLSVLTGILAIAIPYSGVFAKVYAEILEEAGDPQRDRLFVHAGRVSRFAYSKIPDVWHHLKSYTQYRLECGLRSSAILGFIGLPTLGFTLESAFGQGHYSEVWALLILFYFVISTIGFWMRKSLLPIYLIASFVLLPPISMISFDNVVRFLTYDIVPHPLRVAEGMNIDVFMELVDWFLFIMMNQALPGVWNTLLLTQIALVTTAILTLLLFPLVCSKFFGRPVRSASHVLLVILRSTPEYILAYILLQLWGPSMLPAVIAITVHNGAIISHLTGRYANALNLRPDGSVARINRYFFEVVPRIYGQFLAFLFYRWEVIFRETAILGILGISTLGFYIDSAIQDLRMDRALLLIIITALINIFIDIISRHLRLRLRLNFSAVA